METRDAATWVGIESIAARASRCPPLGPAVSAADSPRFADGLKSWDVEDPVNLLIHRPLAYGVARLLMPLGLSPNQITFLSLLAGLSGAACMIAGEPAWMRTAGLLLFLCAIFDGADGIVARLTRTGSRMGQVWDQSTDNVVAIAAVAAATFHVLARGSDPLVLVPLVILAYASGVAHTGFHAFYMEGWLRVTRPGPKRPGAELAEVDAEIAKARAGGSGPLSLLALGVHRLLLSAELAVLALTDPVMSRALPLLRPSAEVAERWRHHNRGLMRAWSFFGNGPHMDALCVLAFLDHLEAYLWLRLVAMNAALLVMIALQRHASRRLFTELGLAMP